MTEREEVHLLIDQLPDETIVELLDDLRSLASETDQMTDEEMAAAERGQAQIDRGEYVTLAELKRSLGE
jgi:hypothetical protein